MLILLKNQTLYRNSSSFNAILDIYRTGMLHLSSNMCALVLQVDTQDHHFESVHVLSLKIFAQERA